MKSPGHLNGRMAGALSGTGPDRKRLPYGPLFRWTGKPRLALPRLHGAEALAPFTSLSDVIRPEAVLLRALECFRVSQKFDQENHLLDCCCNASMPPKELLHRIGFATFAEGS
jgi:hypothetical protein